MTEEKNSLWEEIKFEIGTIGNSLLGDDQKEILIGSGNREGDILFVGDDFELYQNENFKVSPGSSGEFLLKLCDLEDIDPEKYYITTLSKRSTKIKSFMPEDVEKLREILTMQIALINPKLIVCLGSEATKFLLEKEMDIEKQESKNIEWKGGIKVLLTYDVNNVKNSRLELGKKSKIAIKFWNDLKLIKKELDEIYG